MYLDYSKINSERKKQPMLRLRTLAGTELGPIPFVHDLSFKINYADVSEIEFTIPYMVDGKLNPMYGAVTGYKVVYTDTLGIYILTSPQKSGDGVGEEKTLRGYSLEQHFQTKKLYLEEGTYNFWNPANRTDTILERILELDPTWKIGYVAPRLIGCYRTFDEYDNDALSFCYGDAMEKYRCSFVFDVYTKTINVYDADDEAEILPIYLSYKNLVDTVGVDEISDEFATKLCVYGSDKWNEVKDIWVFHCLNGKLTLRRSKPVFKIGNLFGNCLSLVQTTFNLVYQNTMRPSVFGSFFNVPNPLLCIFYFI